MKVTVTLLPTLEEQRASGDTTLIDPAGVNLDAFESAPVFLGWDYAFENVAGQLVAVRLENGRLVGDLEILDSKSPIRFGVGGHAASDGFHLSHVGVNMGPGVMRR